MMQHNSRFESLISMTTPTITATPLLGDGGGGGERGCNVSVNGTMYDVMRYPIPRIVMTSFILGVIILLTIIGNVCVVAAVIVDRHLHNVANYLVASLAITDLMVAAFVMPFAALQVVSTCWFLAPLMCDIWLSVDVSCCTSSILHLVAIAVDRYWAVTRVDYIRNRSHRRTIAMVVTIWVISVSISIPPLFGWKDGAGDRGQGQCMITQDWGYTLYSTIGAFYLPLAVIIFFYARIFQTARARIRKEPFRNRRHVRRSMFNAATSGDYESTCCAMADDASTAVTTTANGQSPPRHVSPHADQSSLSPAAALTSSGRGAGGGGEESLHAQLHHRREKMEQRRERKAARTLAIITGCFVVCWLPFFVAAVVRPFCGDTCLLPAVIDSCINWLGYCNSLANPVIYTVFNADFRKAFHKILCRRWRYS